jgi:4-hydroxybutyrate dehydrogenase
MKKPLVVTDAGVRAAGVLDMALAALGDLPHAVFDQTPSNPTEAAVRAACAVYRARLRRPDRRGRRLQHRPGQGRGHRRHPRRPAEDLRHHRRRQPEDHRAVAPLIAVPTTAGTGSEVARGAIVIVDDGRKLGFHSWHLMPKAAIWTPSSPWACRRC